MFFDAISLWPTSFIVNKSKYVYKNRSKHAFDNNGKQSLICFSLKRESTKLQFFPSDIKVILQLQTQS